MPLSSPPDSFRKATKTGVSGLDDRELKEVRDYVTRMCFEPVNINVNAFSQVILAEEQSRSSKKQALYATVLTGAALFLSVVQVAVAVYSKNH